MLTVIKAVSPCIFVDNCCELFLILSTAVREPLFNNASTGFVLAEPKFPTSHSRVPSVDPSSPRIISKGKSVFCLKILSKHCSIKFS